MVSKYMDLESLVPMYKKKKKNGINIETEH